MRGDKSQLTPTGDRETHLLEVACGVAARTAPPRDAGTEIEQLVGFFAYVFGEVTLPRSLATVDRRDALDHVLTVNLKLTSAMDLDKLIEAGLLHPEYRGWRGVFRDANRKTRRWPERRTVLQALAIHYLSKRGGGSRSLADAAALYHAKLDPEGLAPDLSDAWTRADHYAMVRQIEKEWGPLTRKRAA